MQSYYVDEWEHERVLLEATFTPLAFGGAWLLGAGAEHQRAMLDFGHVGSIGVHLSDRSSGRVGLGAEGSLRASYKLIGDDARRLAFGIARAAEIHFAAGATEVYPNIARVGVLQAGRPGPVRGDRLQAGRAAPGGLPPDGHGADRRRPAPRASAPPTAPCTAADGLYVADASLFPTSVGVNPMMTIIAFSKHVARGVAESGVPVGRLARRVVRWRRRGLAASVSRLTPALARCRRGRRSWRPPPTSRGSRRRRSQAAARPTKAGRAGVTSSGQAFEAQTRRREDAEEDQERGETSEHGDRRAGAITGFQQEPSSRSTTTPSAAAIAIATNSVIPSSACQPLRPVSVAKEVE